MPAMACGFDPRYRHQRFAAMYIAAKHPIFLGSPGVGLPFLLWEFKSLSCRKYPEKPKNLVRLDSGFVNLRFFAGRFSQQPKNSCTLRWLAN